MSKKKWKKLAYEHELAKIKKKGKRESLKRQLGRTKTKARIVGTMKYRKAAALKKALGGAGQTGKALVKSGKKLKGSPLLKGTKKWADNIVDRLERT